MVKRSIEIEGLLRISAKQYCELKKQTEEFVKQIEENHFSDAKKYTIDMKILQDEAIANDERLLPLLTEDLSSWETHTLFVERLQCIQSIISMNALLSPKIKSAMAVTSSEIQKLTGGRVAVAGYASQKGKRKSLMGVIG